MGTISELFRQVTGLFKWWISVMPWESGLRVRLGRWVKVLGPGVHLKLPMVDTAFKQSVRMRVSTLPVQTLTTRDGKTVTLSAAVGYSVRDILRLYNGLHHAEDTIGNLVLSAIGEFVHQHRAEDCSPATVQRAVAGTIELERYGLADVHVYITDFAFVRTFRLISDSRWGTLGTSSGLNTTTPDGHER